MDAIVARMLDCSLLTPSKLPLIEQKQRLAAESSDSDPDDDEMLVKPGRLERKLEAVDLELGEEVKTPANLSKKRTRPLQ